MTQALREKILNFCLQFSVNPALLRHLQIKLFLSLFLEAIEESANRGETGDADVSCEDRNLDPSLVEMLDGVVMLYHIAVHKQLSKVRTIFCKCDL